MHYYRNVLLIGFATLCFSFKVLGSGSLKKNLSIIAKANKVDQETINKALFTVFFSLSDDEINSSLNEKGQTILQIAAKAGAKDFIVSLLKEYDDLDITHLDSKDRNAEGLAFEEGHNEIATMLAIRSIENTFNEFEHEHLLPIEVEQNIREKIIGIYYYFAACESFECEENILNQFHELLELLMVFNISGDLIFFKEALSYPYEILLKNDSLWLRKNIMPIFLFAIQKILTYSLNNPDYVPRIYEVGKNAILTAKHFGPRWSIVYYWLSKKLAEVQYDKLKQYYREENNWEINRRLLLNLRHRLLNNIYDEFIELDAGCSYARQLFLLASISHFPSILNRIYFAFMNKKEKLMKDIAWEKKQENLSEFEKEALYDLECNVEAFQNNKESIWKYVREFTTNSDWIKKVEALEKLFNSDQYTLLDVKKYVKRFTRGALDFLFHHWDRIDLSTKLTLWKVLNTPDRQSFIKPLYTKYLVIDDPRVIARLPEKKKNLLNEYLDNQSEYIDGNSNFGNDKARKLLRRDSRRSPTKEKDDLPSLVFSNPRKGSRESLRNILKSPRRFSPRSFDAANPNVLDVRFYEEGEKFRIPIKMFPLGI